MVKFSDGAWLGGTGFVAHHVSPSVYQLQYVNLYDDIWGCLWWLDFLLFCLVTTRYQLMPVVPKK